jgi:hypothetical protein
LSSTVVAREGVLALQKTDQKGITTVGEACVIFKIGELDKEREKDERSVGEQ